MKKLLTIVGIALVVAWLGSCAVGYAVADAGGVGLVLVLRDLSIMLFALYVLVAALLTGALFGAGAWAIERFGGKAVAGIRWVGTWVGKAEHWVEKGAEEGVVRPLARAGGAIVAGRTFTREVVQGAHAPLAVHRYPRAVTRTISSLAQQLRRVRPSPGAEKAPADGQPTPAGAAPRAGEAAAPAAWTTLHAATVAGEPARIHRPDER